MNRNYISALSNNRGHIFEKLIEAGCKHYAESGQAYIIKTPEPFRVINLDRKRHTATVHFTAHAQPDFIGTLKSGKSIVFEAKSTINKRINYDCITPTQAAALEKHFTMGAYAGVACQIDEDFFFIPWEIWRDMQKIFKRKYIKADDVREYQIKLDYVRGLLFLQNKAVAE